MTVPIDATHTGDAVVGVPDAPSVLGTLHGVAHDYAESTGFVGLTIKCCAMADTLCAFPLATATSSAMGSFDLGYPLGTGGFDGYIEFTGGGGGLPVVPTRWFVTLSLPITTMDFGLIPLNLFSSVSTAIPSVTFDSTHGAVVFDIQQVSQSGRAGAAVSASPSAGMPFYIAGATPSLTATETDMTGQGGFFGTAPGMYTFTTRDAATRTVLGTTVATVRGGYVTSFTLVVNQ